MNIEDNTTTTAAVVAVVEPQQYNTTDKALLTNQVPITITLDNVNVTLRNGETIFTKLKLTEPKQAKSILTNISAIIHPGQICAILGGSGSGKTTLLNTISGRYSKDEMKVDGTIMFNTIKSPSPALVKKAVGYVMQRDYLLPNLTVRESLDFSALLRLPVAQPYADKMKRVDTVLAELGLRDCANTRIGGDGKRGVSGGEKRRVSIGCQMLTDPSVLFLDEPTTGLDSFTAFQVTQTLATIARQNRTVICTIHQPRSDIFKLFDMVMLLSKGQLVYIGTVPNMIQHFSRLNFVCPKLENPADYFIDICSIDYRSPALEHNSTERLKLLVEGFRQSNDHSTLLALVHETKTMSNAADGDNTAKLTSQLRKSIPFYRSVPTLTRRSYTNHLRDLPAAITRISQIVSFGLMMCLAFLRLTMDQYGIQNRTGFLYESLSMIFIALLSCVALFPQERNSFYRERSDGLYSTVAFFFSYMMVEIPFNAFGALGYAGVSYFTLGMHPGASHFFTFALTVFVLLFSGESVGLFVCSLFYDVGMATTIANVILSLFAVLAGFFRPNGQLPVVLEYFNYALPTKWAAEVLAINEFTGAKFDCPGNQSLDGKGIICPISTGEEVLASYGWNGINIHESLIIMVAISIGYRIIGLLALQFNRRSLIPLSCESKKVIIYIYTVSFEFSGLVEFQYLGD
eukprot:gene16895-20090_t